MRVATSVIVMAMVAFGVPSGAASAPIGGEPRQDGAVVEADGGSLALEPGPGEFATRGGDGTVVLGVTGDGAAGVNVGGRFVFGDPADPTRRPAFTLANTDRDPRDVRIGYRTGDDGDPDANLQFRLFDRSGGHVATVSEESGPVSVRIDGDETLYTAVVVDTRGLTDAADLSGSLVVRR